MGHFLQVGLFSPNLHRCNLAVAYCSNSWHSGHNSLLCSFFLQYRRIICSTTRCSSFILFMCAKIAQNEANKKMNANSFLSNLRCCRAYRDGLWHIADRHSRLAPPKSRSAEKPSMPLSRRGRKPIFWISSIMPVAEYISGKFMFIYFYLLYLNTLTRSLSSPTSWLHWFSIPVSEKPHFSMTFPDAGLSQIGH